MSVPPNVQAFVDKYLSAAQKNEQLYAVPWQVTLAQAGIESGWGKHAPKYNFFGIKADKSWKGAVQFLRTREVIGGADVYIDAKFRAYDKPLDSFIDHALFLKNNRNYRPAFDTANPREFAKRVAAGGYATDPNYAKSLVSVMDWLEEAARQKPTSLPVSSVELPPRKPGLLAFFLRLLGLGK